MDDAEAYLRTTFEAETPVGRIEVRVGDRDTRIERLLEFCSADDWAFFTAWNPEGTFTNETENRRRQEAMESELEDREGRVFPGEAVPDPAEWAPEQAVLVVGLSRTAVLQVAGEYGQDAMVWGTRGEAARLIDCETGEEIEKGRATDSDAASAAAEVDDVLDDLGGTVQDSVERYRSDPPNSLEDAVDWELVLRSLDDEYPDPDLD